MEAEPTETTTATPTARVSTEEEKTDLDQLAKKRLPAPVKDKGKSSANSQFTNGRRLHPVDFGQKPSGETGGICSVC